MYGLSAMDIVYLFMAWVAIQVLMLAFDVEGNVCPLCKIIFPIIITLIILLIMIWPFIMFGR